MQPALTFFWIVAGITFLAGAVITILSLHRAPEAFEDADGFHYLPPSGRLSAGNGREHADVTHPAGVKLA